MPGIGIISSVVFRGTALETAFDAGLNMPLLYRAPREDDLGRNSSALSGALTRLDTNANVSVIVAVGGIAIQDATDSDPNANAKDYVALFGGIRKGHAPGGRNKAWLSLESAANHAHRIQYLHSTWNIQPNQVCLLCNQSSMSGDEHPSFGNRYQEVQVGKGSTDALAQFQQAFVNIGNNYRAVVISADPFFLFDFHIELQQTAYAWATADGQRRLCYSLQEFDTLAPAALNQTTLWGPPLYRDDPAHYALGAYKILGKMVSNVINGTSFAVPALQQYATDK